jgi:hypothetical protein
LCSNILQNSGFMSSNNKCWDSPLFWLSATAY